ncbi:hypothetical protein D9619_006866 [Psilocybe cf. subviscida]|uniref:Vacuolar protein sorting/targeting protein 10 n=1 Tax=Psilocybe cf. subviscida TaxID=2480587 RepID=A0A8H5B4V0_9AGAR|nr:hypothetical protein D9619_006866 [Psilocybe cf. subviscida]
MMARQRKGVLAILFRALLLLAFSAVLVAAQGKPESAVSSFHNFPTRLFFFDDTKSVLYHDPFARDVYISRDEGKTWKLAEGIPKGSVFTVLQHPTDNRYAFAIADGKTHYRTEDRGRIWRPFDVPLPPAFTLGPPLSFHSDPKKYDHILYQGLGCEHRGLSASCHVETYYTTKAFSDDVKPLRKHLSRCQFAHGSKEFKHEAHEDLIYCVSSDTSSSSSAHSLSGAHWLSGAHSLSASKLYSSTDFFDKDIKVEDLGTGKIARGVIAFAIVGKFAVVTVKDMTKSTGDILLYVTVDTKTWAQAHFPSSVRLREKAYTMLESTTHSLVVDVVLQERSSIGTLFISNGNGTYFVESLKDTNRNTRGHVDYERIHSVEGVGLANIVANAAAVERQGAAKNIRTVATFDDGSSWVSFRPPTEDVDGKTIHCDPKNSDDCALHLHSVTSPHHSGRGFPSPAPGFVMGVGSIGKHLLSYEECDTFLSTDAGVSWRMVARGAHKYKFGDSASILIAVDDGDVTKEIKYSLDLGKSWKTYDFGVRLHALGLITPPDSTSQKFLLLGQVAKADQTKEVGSAVIVSLDFTKTRGRKCNDDDFEKWYARPQDSQCLLGRKQWYKRRKPDADCYVGEKREDSVVHEDPCSCTDADYECDYNFIRVGDECELQGHEQVPPNVCRSGRPDDEYEGSSGYRKIAGDTCEGGLKKDAPVMRQCSQAPPEGDIASHFNPFDSPDVQQVFFKDSKTILVRMNDHSMWQSSNEGQTWNEIDQAEKFFGVPPPHASHTDSIDSANVQQTFFKDSNVII